MSTLIGVTTAAAGLVLALAGCGSTEPQVFTTPSVEYTPVAHKVVYAADGSVSTTANYTWATPGGGTQQAEGADLPLMTKGTDEIGITYDGFGSGAFVYLSVQNAEEYGSVTCRIIVDGVEVSVNTSSGAYVIATCEGAVP